MRVSRLPASCACSHGDCPYELLPGFSGAAPYCSFPVTTAFTEKHRLSFHFDLPDGVSPESVEAFLYQISGQHFVDIRETVTNPATGSSIDLHGTIRVIRRDIDTSDVTTEEAY